MKCEHSKCNLFTQRLIIETPKTTKITRKTNNKLPQEYPNYYYIVFSIHWSVFFLRTTHTAQPKIIDFICMFFWFPKCVIIHSNTQ